MRTHSTKILQEILSALSGFVQGSFAIAKQESTGKVSPFASLGCKSEFASFRSNETAEG